MREFYIMSLKENDHGKRVVFIHLLFLITYCILGIILGT
jgi:hypothetical protein